MRNSVFHKLRFSFPKVIIIGYGVLFIIFSSCNPSRRVEQGQYLLTHNSIKYATVPLAKGKGIEKRISSITKQQFANLKIPADINAQMVLAYIKQKPNTKILGLFPLHLFIYNLVNPEKAAEKKLERDQKIDKKNKDRIAAGKKAKSDEQIKAKKEKKTWREWLMGAGEPPVILDSSLMTGSIKQVTLFLKSKGYYDCKVRDSVCVKNRKAKVFYIIKPGRPYRIDSLRYYCADPLMLPVVYSDSANCLINQGDIYDHDAFIKERDRLTHHLNDNGYYAFSKEYIHYVIDSGAGNHLWNTTISVNKFVVQDSANSDSNVEIPHPVFHINKVIIQMQYNPSIPNYIADDTLRVGEYTFVYPNKEIGFKPKRLLNKIFIKEGDLYRISNVDYTYTGLSQLKTFRYISIKFIETANNGLDCYIRLMPTVKQSVDLEVVGDDTGGDLGIQGDIVYQNKNLGKGAELFQFKVKGGIEAQKSLGSATPVNNNGINNLIQLNTINYGGEMDLAIPRALFPFNIGANIDSVTKHTKMGLWPKANPQTVLKATYDYQNLPEDYARHIFGLAYTFNYDPYEKKDEKKWHIELKLPEINYVYATLTDQFKGQLDNAKNFFLLNGFTNHFVPDIRATVVFNDQVLTKLRNFNYVKIDIEESGYLLRAATPILSGQLPQLIPDPNRSYSISGVPYSYYVKGDFDYRHYFVLSKDDKLVTRVYMGMGIPMAGVPQELPFDKSFWAGGSNDIRGWAARTLGPGGNARSDGIVDQIGDIKMEVNGEYRVNVIKLLGLALFVDGGNIWLLNSNPAVPNGDFKWTGPNNFINQWALATGIGLRFDFTYFVFRFDFGEPLRNPALPLGHEWVSGRDLTRINNFVLNLGIGYPF